MPKKSIFVGYYNLIAMTLNTLGVQLEGMNKSEKNLVE